MSTKAKPRNTERPITLGGRDSPGITLAVPIGPPPGPDAYAGLHIDLNLRNSTQARGWRQLMSGLDEAGERLQDGRRVQTATDAARWIGERIAAEIGGDE